MADDLAPAAAGAPRVPLLRNTALAAITGAAGVGLLAACAVFTARARQDVAFAQLVRAHHHEVRLQQSRAAVRAAGGDPDALILGAESAHVSGELVARMVLGCLASLGLVEGATTAGSSRLRSAK